MLTLLIVIVVAAPTTVTVGSKVIVKDPITGLTAGRKTICSEVDGLRNR